MAAGAFTGGKIIPYGRRLAMIFTSLIGCFGVGLTMIENFYVLLIGRIFFGFATGSQGVIVIRMINEYVPDSIASICFGIFVAMQNFSAFIALLFGLILPKDTDTAALDENKSWRLIFAVPFIFFGMILFGFLVIIRHDSPKYYISKGDRAMAIHAIHSVYKTNGSDYLAEQVIADFERKMNSGACGGAA